MATKTAQKIVGAFNRGESAKAGNGESTGTELKLFGNLIAYRNIKGEVRVTTAGFNTATTLRWLNEVTGVAVIKSGDKLYINCQSWDGGWVDVKDVTPWEIIKVTNNL